ncbi:hypothetical protein AALP_AA5G174000 [Arabis alpina]|uniref:Legume lectin domain-containing protein n=1 Tax=Arabis alpina TaxID=50452 RepID=A0A087GXQ2_ARAAL|nr:hypothetical protein AALP_AA5G174000 [Arabis alpina]
MASFTPSRSLFLILLALLSLSMSESTSLSFSFTSSDKNATFASEDIALYGDAKLVDGGSSIQLNDSVSHGGGLVVYKKPTWSVTTFSDYFTGFSTVFSFSMSPGRGGRFGFVMFPANGTFDPFFEVKLDISENFSVTVIANGSTVSETMSNVTIVYSEKEKKEKLLYVWINYEATSYSLHVRLSKGEDFNKSADSLYMRWLNLMEEDDFMAGLKSYSGNFTLHSWNLGAGYSPKREHSHLMIDMPKIIEAEEAAKKRRRERMWGIVTGVVMTFASTGLVFFAMMRIWGAFKRNSLAMAMPEECGLKAKQLEKMEVVMSKAEKQERK